MSRIGYVELLIPQEPATRRNRHWRLARDCAVGRLHAPSPHSESRRHLGHSRGHRHRHWHWHWHWHVRYRPVCNESCGSRRLSERHRFSHHSIGLASRGGSLATHPVGNRQCHRPVPVQPDIQCQRLVHSSRRCTVCAKWAAHDWNSCRHCDVSFCSWGDNVCDHDLCPAPRLPHAEFGGRLGRECPVCLLD